jgi:hypothetical protein
VPWSDDFPAVKRSLLLLPALMSAFGLNVIYWAPQDQVIN